MPLLASTSDSLSFIDLAAKEEEYDDDDVNDQDDDKESQGAAGAAIARASNLPGEETIWDNFVEVFVDHKEAPERYFMKKVSK